MRGRLRVALANSLEWVTAPQGVVAGVLVGAVGAVAGALLFHEPRKKLLVVLAGLAVGGAVYLAVVFLWHLARAGHRLRPKRLEFQKGHADSIVGYRPSPDLALSSCGPGGRGR